MGPRVSYLLAVCVVACLIHLVPVRSQCTTKHCIDDDNDENVLTAMVARLQDTVDHQERHNLEILDSMEQLHQQFNHTVEQLRQDHQRSTEQLLQLFNQSMVEQLTRLEATLEKHTEYATDCTDLLRKGYRTSGVYDIYLANVNKKIKVFCDMETDNGGWLIFQKRQDGSVDFFRDWKNYKEGFGNLTGEFWLGNDYMHEITSQANYTLRVDLTAFNGATAFAVYTTFAVASESANYKLSIGGYRGTAGNSMGYNGGMAFSTKERDNDMSGNNCAMSWKGAWWFNACSRATLNGWYRHDGSRRSSAADGINWYDWLGWYYSLQQTEMKIRP